MSGRIPIYNHLPTAEECIILQNFCTKGEGFHAPNLFTDSILLYGVTKADVEELLFHTNELVNISYSKFEPFKLEDVVLKSIVLCDSKATAIFVALFLESLSDNDKDEISLLGLATELGITPENPWRDVCTLSMNSLLSYLEKTQRQSRIRDCRYNSALEVCTMTNDTVMVFGFSDSENIFQSLLPNQNICIWETDLVSDLIAVPCMASVMNINVIKDNEIQMIYEYYSDVIEPTETVILIGHSKVDVPQQLAGFFVCYDNLDIAKEKLKYDFLSAYRRQKKSESFSRTVANALTVLRQIKRQPGISSAKLASQLELSPRTIQRYIESLRIAGEWITYDHVKKGWKLFEGKSLLFGDYDRTSFNVSFDALWFFDEFTKRITWEKYAETYKNDALFTPMVTKAINEIIENGTGWTHQNEYFRIDAVGWESHYQNIKKEANDVGLNAHLWNLKIAVEHENNKQDWTDELMKLLQIRCPLKVIIGYNYYDERENNEREKINVASRLVVATDAYESIARDREEILLILGNGCSAETGKSDYTSFDYRGYLFNYGKEKFVPFSESID